MQQTHKKKYERNYENTNETMSDPNISTETGEAMQGRSPRFTQWIAFLVFSTITLGSSVEVVSLVPIRCNGRKIGSRIDTRHDTNAPRT
jgi:hypothetical protein